MPRSFLQGGPTQALCSINLQLCKSRESPRRSICRVRRSALRLNVSNRQGSERCSAQDGGQPGNPPGFCRVSAGGGRAAGASSVHAPQSDPAPGYPLHNQRRSSGVAYGASKLTGVGAVWKQLVPNWKKRYFRISVQRRT